MRKTIKIIFSFMFLFSSILVGATQTNIAINAAIGDTIAQAFPDTNLAKSIADSYTSGDVNAVLDQDLVDLINALDISGKSVQDLTGIELLVNLTVLNANSNGWTSLPSQILALENLEELNLYDNKITSLPEEISNLTNLKRLGMENNSLTSLPDTIGSLTNLEFLFLNNNKLTELPSTFTQLTNLRTIELYGNQVTALPDDIGNLTQLTYIGFNGNSISTIPTSIGNITSLQTFDFSNNDLTTLPTEFGNLANLKTLNIVGNMISSLPDSIGNLSSLELFYVYQNNLTTLPDTIGDLTNLIVLDINGNLITSLPDTISNLSSLIYLKAYGNKLTELPSTIGQLDNLYELDLGTNRIAQLPDSISNMDMLENLIITGNQLTSLPDTMGNFQNLKVFFADSNKLTALPDSIGSITTLELIDFTANALTSLPSSIASLTNLRYANFRLNLLPTGYSTTLNALGLNMTFDEASQSQLTSFNSMYEIKSETDFLGINLLNDVNLPSFTSLNLVLENLVDENQNTVSLSDYIQSGQIVKEGKVYAQIRATGTGIFPNNSDHALTPETIGFNFLLPSSLSFDLNGATGTTPSTQYLFEGELSTAVSDPIRTGYTFKGWNTQADGSGMTWDFSTNTMLNQDTTLYAMWELSVPTHYTLSFDLNGGQGTTPPSQYLNTLELPNKPADPVNAGYTFKGWNTQADGLGMTWDFSTNTMLNQDTTLYAMWEVSALTDYTLSFDLNGGQGTTPPTQYLNSRELPNKPADPVNAGYTFKGWNTQADGLGMTWDFSTNTTLNQDTTLYAMWEVSAPTDYTLSFDLNGGNGLVPSDQILAEGAIATAPANPTRDGYHFVGWNTLQDGSGINWNFSTDSMPSQNVTLYALWSLNPITSYTLSFDLNGGTGLVPTTQSLIEGEIAIQPSNPIREGYMFKGWNTQANGSGMNWDFSTGKMPNQNITLYAIWEQNPVGSYTLSFNLNGGHGLIPSSQLLGQGDLATQPVAPARQGYSFKEWNTQADGLGLSWNFESSLMPNHDVTLYAIWTAESLPDTGISNNTSLFGLSFIVVGLGAFIARKRKQNTL